MHTADEEFYVFLRFSDGDVSQAIQALDHIAKTDIEFIRLSLLKDAAISYCRPFKISRGTIKKKLKLNTSLIPPTLLKLHEELIALRDQVFAHSDLDIRAAELYCWTRSPKLTFPIRFKGHDYPQFLARIDELRFLFNEVLRVIRDKQLAIETEFEKRIPRGAAPGTQFKINL